MISKKFFLVGLLIVIFFARTEFVDAEEMVATASPTPAPIEYQLPYPGILPGHPFYWLKNIRDNLVGFMISSPLKKAEYNLLQSDKDLQAAVYLYDQGGDKKAMTQVLQESNMGLEQAINDAQLAKKQGLSTIEFFSKITIASLKHQEVVLNLVKTAKNEDKKVFESSLKNLNDLVKKAKELDPK